MIERVPSYELRQAAKHAISQFLEETVCVKRLWVAPDAWAAYGDMLSDMHARQNNPDCEIKPIGPDWPVTYAPAVVLMTESDVNGKMRSQLLDIAQCARPGRPVVVGRTKDTLLDAINHWHAFRVVDPSLPVENLADALEKSFDALCTTTSLTECIHQLQRDCDQLDCAVTDLNAAQSKLLHQERLSAIGQMTNLLIERAHKHFDHVEKLGSALAPLGTDPDVSGILSRVVDGTRAIATLLGDLLALAENRSQPPTLKHEALDSLVKQSLALFRVDPLAAGFPLSISCQSNATVNVDRYRIYHVLTNLLRNAVQSSTEAAPIEIRTFINAEATHAVIELEDHGSGMSEETRLQIFNPFFSTKGKSGVGLGLQLCRNTLAQQSGSLACKSQLGLGSCFRIELPLVRIP